MMDIYRWMEVAVGETDLNSLCTGNRYIGSEPAPPMGVHLVKEEENRQASTPDRSGVPEA
jgi:hypothetical protein